MPDLYLLRIFDLLVQTQREIKKTIKTYQSKLSDNNGIEHKLAVSQNPVKRSLQFATPYGYMAAYLLADFDRLVCLIVSLKYRAIISEDVAKSIIRKASRKIRQVLSLPLKWQATSVTRSDITAENQRAKIAFEKMGRIHPDIISTNLRAPYAPRIVKVNGGMDE